MEKKMMGFSVLGLGMVILVLSACPSDAITCPEAVASLLPCQPFLVGAGLVVPGLPCCLGVQNIFNQVGTTETRRALCQCLKNVAAGLGVNPDRAKLIPQLCHVNVPVPIDPNVDCSTVP